MHSLSRATHVLIMSHDRVGALVAGPGLRYQGFAGALAREFDVILAAPAASDGTDSPPYGACPAAVGENGPWRRRTGEGVQGAAYSYWPYEAAEWSSIAAAVQGADVIIAPGDMLTSFPELGELGIPLVVDGYIPHLVETLALGSADPMSEQAARYEARLAVVRNACRSGDFFLCASERQRDWWLGQLEALGRINPYTHAADPTLRKLVDVVPYGLPAEPPTAPEPAIRGVWPGVGDDDQILLWGGGLWEWLDPLTAVRAVDQLVKESPSGGRLRLLFPGTRHPNPSMPDMPARAQALALADELGITGQHVFFGEWIPHEAWPAVLLEADVGLSLHPDTVETRLGYRTRLLDYIWAGLPMVITEGDYLGEFVRARGLGIVVGYGDSSAVAAGIARVLEQPRSAWKDRFARVQAEMNWEQAVRPLAAFCRDPHRAADRVANAQSIRYSDPASLGRGPNPATLQGEDEIKKLRRLVAGYEKGRFIRLMRWWAGWRQRMFSS